MNLSDTSQITMYPPRYASERREALWEGPWGRVAVSPTDLDDSTSALTVSVEIDPFSDYLDGMPAQVAREVAAATSAAADAADGLALGWTQYRAESMPAGQPDPEHPGMVQVAPGHWEGLSRLTETFDARIVASYHEEYLREGRDVTMYARTFNTLSDVTAWAPVPFIMIDAYEPQVD